MDPILHYLLHGAKQGLNPSQGFDTNFYLKNNPDVEATGINPLVHYLQIGITEGQFPKKPSKLVILDRYLRDLIRRPELYLSKILTLFAYWRTYGLKGVNDLLASKLRQESIAISINYEEWLKIFGTLTDEDCQNIRKHLKTFAKKPLISVIMPTYNTPEAWLRCAIDSVLEQLYPYWELCIADDASTEKHVRKVLEEYQEKDKRIKVVFRNKNGHISAASNSALDIATGEWIALLDHDDELAKHALYMVAYEINQHPKARLFYSDEDKITAKNKHYDAYFKPDWNLSLFLSQNYVSHLGVYQRKRVQEIGGFRQGYEGSQDYDLALRFIAGINPASIIHIPHVLYHWRSVAGSTAAATEEKSYAAKAGLKALQDFIKLKGIEAKAELVPNWGSMYRLRYSAPEPLPLVSIIIPTRDGYEFLERCISSILSKTDYPNFDIIIVDNQSTDTHTLNYLQELQEHKHKVQIILYDDDFNYSAMNNLAAQNAKGEILCLLNNDTEVINKDWLTEMVSQACRPNIGAVGAKLLYPDGKVQHGGVILGLGGVAEHAHKFFSDNSPGYFGRAGLVQEISAVTAACLVVRKKFYQQVNGLNEKNLSIAFNDVDFCLKLLKLSYRNVWTPYARLYHYESKSRGKDSTPEQKARFLQEINYMHKHWNDILKQDPMYNPNLSLRPSQVFSLDAKTRVKKPWSTY